MSSIVSFNYYNVDYCVEIEAASIIDDNILCYEEESLNIYICYRYSENILNYLF